MTNQKIDVCVTTHILNHVKVLPNRNRKANRRLKTKSALLKNFRPIFRNFQISEVNRFPGVPEQILTKPENP